MTTSASRLTDAARDLASRSGYHGAGINEVLAQAGLGNGSLYHAFPGGKPQLVAAAITEESERMSEVLTTLLDRGPAEAVQAFFGAAERELRRSDFAHGCRVTTALADGADIPPLQHAGQEAIDRWVDLVAAALRDAGADHRRARSSAHAIVALYVGAWVTSRTSRSTTPMRAARDAALALLPAAVSS
jgi:TetR/AcrR family transcriptional repressor of lmrAB and yxaGH operons